MKQFFFFIFLISYIPTTANAHIPEVNIFTLNNSNKNISFYQVLKSKSFKPVALSKLNFGITNTTHWLKIDLKNLDTTHAYKINIETITPDSIEVYEVYNNTFYKHSLIGEGFVSSERNINYHFRPIQPKAIFYLKIIGNGQPIALPIQIIDKNLATNDDLSMFFKGIIYGIIALILTLNVILYITTFEKIYLYIFFFNTFATLVLMYFEGFIKLVFFPNSLYWNNQSVAIAMCGSFIMTNLYISQFLKIKSYNTVFQLLFKILNVSIGMLLALSFWHPSGFKYYIILNLFMLTVEALLLSASVLYVRKKEKDYFYLQLTAVIMLVVFGVISQFYFLGILQINLFTQNVIYLVILPQIFIQTFVLGKRLTIIIKEKSLLQTSMLNISELHAQSLILTLEKERKRLSSEFHDNIGQNILVIRNRVLLMLKKDRLSLLQVDRLNSIAALTLETLDEVRTIAQDLRPSTLDTFGITASIEFLVEKIKISTQINIQFQCMDNIDEILPQPMEINLYRILQELFNNLLKHSSASDADIKIWISVNRMNITFQDNGKGFDDKEIKNYGIGNGLVSIKERVNIFKGTIAINSAIDKGTQIQIIIPITLK